MSNKSRLSPWPQYPNIPIFLETPDDVAPKSYGGTEQASNVPKLLIPSGRSPRYMTIASPVSPLSSTTTTTNFSLKVPNVGPQKPLPLQPRRPPLRYFLDKREYLEPPMQTRPSPSLRHQAHTNHFTKKQQTSHVDTTHENPSEKTSDSTSSLGLGIVDGSITQPGPPTTPSILEKDEGPSNFAQRFEKKILNYNSSKNLLKRWLLEIISWILSALCMGAIFGVLLFLKDESLPKWPLGLTLNAYISILSKIAGAALLLPTAEALGQLKWNWFQQGSRKMLDFEIFDNASRGPWGSFMLLLRTKGRSLAALGAVITIFSLALDPFFQQVIDFPERWIRNGTSSIPRVVSYDSADIEVFVSGQSSAIQELYIKSVTDKFFISNGTQPVPFGNGTRPEVPVSCPTQNCTWPVYETLGVCSSCVDIPDIVTFGCLSTKVDWIKNLTGIDSESMYPNATQCGYFLNITSEIPILLSGYLVEPVQSEAGTAEAGEALLMRALPLSSNPYKVPRYGDGSIKFKHIRNKIQDGLFSSIPDGLVENVYQNRTPIVQECMLAWCVKRLNSSYSWANYDEHVLDIFFNETNGPAPYPWLFDSDGMVTEYEGDSIIRAPDSNGTATYNASNLATTRTITIFMDLFPSFYTAQNASDKPYFRFQTNIFEARWRTVEFNPWLSPNNVSRHLERLSTAITDALRSSRRSEPIYGQAFTLERYVAVRWEWLTLPVGLLACSFIFLAATIYSSSGQDGVWKTSAIATLIYGLPDDMQRKIRSSTQTGTPRSRAKELKVKLQSRDWRISGALLSPMTPRRVRNRPPSGWI